ncbi:uncharacterized protein sb:cb288 isoform X3 [Sander lucioperca]|uniref:uncharacterized protein sb:cb288 isoform X3 n=1 Tax=Sander lucioperca TaxID=283035 RepID=UPI0016534902|nr:uncharacterized protein sb:cb288 isoform X3 [Sander lucioperca]
MQHERRTASAHISGEKKTKQTEEVWPHSLKNVDRSEKQEQDSHRQREQLEGAIAATVFIAFLLALYAVLWKCMVSPPPQRKHSKVRMRVKQRTSV